MNQKMTEEELLWQTTKLRFIRHRPDPTAKWRKSFFRKKATNLRNTT